MIAEKTCERCGRRITWRKAWARDWDAVRFCGERCRRTRLSAVDAALESTILTLATARGRHGSLCPSEAARAVAPDAWRPLMEAARQAARRLHARGLVRITQHGHPVDPSAARGPIRVALA